MPAVNPKYICQPCARGAHAYCTMEDVCTCPNTWDGDGWKSIQDRVASKANVAHLTTHTGKGRSHSEARPLVGAGRALWICDDCRYECKAWKGCERFKYCTECERKHLEIERRKIALEQKEQGAVARNGDTTAGEGQGMTVQPSLPLPAHSGRKRADSPCDKKDPGSA